MAFNPRELDACGVTPKEFDAFVDGLGPPLDELMENEFLARPVGEALARFIQGAELIRHSIGEVVDGFMATRMGTRRTAEEPYSARWAGAARKRKPTRSLTAPKSCVSGFGPREPRDIDIRFASVLGSLCVDLSLSA